MTNARMTHIDDYRDLDSIRAYRAMLDEGLPEEEVMERLMYRSRDNVRTPMQWNGGQHAGFTRGEPWMRVNPEYHRINAQEDMANTDGIYHFYQRLIALRKQKEAVIYGGYELLLPEHPEIFCFLRRGRFETLLVVCNFFDGHPLFELPERIRGAEKTWVLSNYPEMPVLKDKIVLRPYEAFVVSLPST